MVSCLGVCGCIVLAACSGGDSGGGGNGGTAGGAVDVVKLAADACAREEAGGCAPSSSCEDDYKDEWKFAEAFGCKPQLQAFLECAGQGDWTCTSSGGGLMIESPEECQSLESDATFCGPSCGSFISGTTCNMDCDEDGVLYAGSCTEQGCSCTAGAKSGASFSIDECSRGNLAQALVANCR